MDLLMQHLNNGMWLSLMLSLPPVLLAAAIGLIIGILQAVTSVQEQTISAAPKILVVFLMLIFGGGVMLNMMTDYIRESFIVAFEEVPQQETHLLPPLPRSPGQMRAAAFYKGRLAANSNGKTKAFLEGSSDLKSSATQGFNTTQVFDKSAQLKPQPGFGEQLMLKKRGTP